MENKFAKLTQEEQAVVRNILFTIQQNMVWNNKGHNYELNKNLAMSINDDTYNRLFHVLVKTMPETK